MHQKLIKGALITTVYFDIQGFKISNETIFLADILLTYERINLLKVKEELLGLKDTQYALQKAF